MTSLRSSRLHLFRLYPRFTANGMISSWITCASRWLTSQRTNHTNHLISFNSVSQSAASRQSITSQSSPSIRTVRCQRSLPLPAFIRSSLFLNPAAMAEQQQFYLLLSNLMSPDNTVRKQSEVRKSFRNHFLWMYEGKCNVFVSSSLRSFNAGPSASLWPSTCVKRALLLCGSDSFHRADSFERADSRTKLINSFESSTLDCWRLKLFIFWVFNLLSGFIDFFFYQIYWDKLHFSYS